MSEVPKCYFLDVPREISNMIYDKISMSCMISAGVGPTAKGASIPKPRIDLLNTTTPSMLQLCRQITEEYREQCLPHSELDITFDGDSGLGFLPGFSVQLLRPIRRCTIFLHWSCVILPDRSAKTAQWYAESIARGNLHYEDMPWTPSKGEMVNTSSQLE